MAPNMAPNMAPGMKASPVKEFLGLRKTLDKRVIPAIRRSVTEALAGQRADVVAWIRAHGEHLTRKPTDTGWWNAEREQKRLVQAIRPHVAGIAELVTARGKDVFPAKADPFEERVAAFVWSRTGQRIRDMEATTRRLVMEAIAQGFADGLAPGQIADILEESSIFDPVRAELIARTETMLAYNDASLSTYREYDIELVEALDGDEDEECRTRLANGTDVERYGPGVYTIEAAMDDTDHPNGTLDWMPFYAAKAEPTVKAVDDQALVGLRAAINTLGQPPVTHVDAPIVNIPAPIVNINTDSFAEALIIMQSSLNASMKGMVTEMVSEMVKPVTRTVERDADGRPVRVVETRA